MTQSKGAILIVDDESVVVEIVSERLDEEGYLCAQAFSGEEALEKMESQSFDLVLTDYHMPGISGIDLIKKIKLLYPDTVVILMTAHNEVKIAVGAMKEGAYDYIAKPFDLDDLSISIKRALGHRKLELEAKEYEKKLEERVRERTAQLMEQIQKNRELLKGLVKTLVELRETRDPYSKGHNQKVLNLALKLGKLASLSGEELKNLELAASVYDVGKIAISDRLLNKPGRLTEEEFEEVKKYVIYSEKILSKIEPFVPVLHIIRAHRERPDGKGYPDKLLNEEIPKEAKIIGLVDSWVAMNSERPYRKALGEEVAKEELLRNKGTQFDSGLVSLFLEWLSQQKDG